MPHLSKYWRIPPKQNTAFMHCMEDVLKVYALPYDAKNPVVCMDETSKQQIGGMETSQPAKPGQPKRVEHEHIRHGVDQLFLAVEALTGGSRVAVGETHTRKDWARWTEGMLTTCYPDAERVILGSDNLKTHAIQSLNEIFPPTQARALTQRLAIHFSTKQASWLNIAEIDLSILSGQCLNRRPLDLETLRWEVAAREVKRNERDANTDWLLTTDDTRTKLKGLHPTLWEFQGTSDSSGVPGRCSEP